MPAEEFERIAAAAEREGVRMEFMHGRPGAKAEPDGNHDEIIRWLTKRCMRHRPDLWLYPARGLRVERHRKGRARPAGTLAPKGTFAGQGEWADPGQVVMIVEVTPHDSDADRRAREEKPSAYAQTGIPVYLLIDRGTRETVVHTEPDGDTYAHLARRPFGRTIHLPDPVGITLDTEPLKDWVR
ncbi:Uma2 family endonuclease [Streptomyces sp. R302]|nr:MULTISPECIES: Uma2 family endonuclease [unclassified Streptomyces]NML50012.1 Uma2 family endonuclease [Streptomyces sp. R301]NML79003.1 Uma2 family endonuclease [Streptomyces sp. R302]